MMIDEPAVLAAIDRVGKIAWRQEAKHLGSQTALMREYLRRSAVVAETLGRTGDWPWYDAAAELTLPGLDRRFLSGYVFLDPEPEYRGPETDPLEAKIIALNNYMNTNPYGQGLYGRKICWQYIRWASVKNHPALASLQLPDLYEPLIAFYERGGRFHREQGYLDLEGVNVTVAGWRSAAQQAPLPSLDQQVLDEIDQAWKP